MQKIFGLTLLFLLTMTGWTAAQTNTTTGWVASFNTFSLKNKWSLHLDLQLRSTDHIEQLQTILIRPGVNYHLRKNQVLTAGYAYISNRYALAGDNALLAEHRIWQQFIVTHRAAITAVQHRFRVEERFLPVPALENGELKSNDHVFSTRLRYFIRSVILLGKRQTTFQQGMFFAPQNEVFFNTTNSNNVNGKFFDQNRLYGALGYRFSKSFDMEAGFMWQFVERREGLGPIHNHIGQIAVYVRNL